MKKFKKYIVAIFCFTGCLIRFTVALAADQAMEKQTGAEVQLVENIDNKDSCQRLILSQQKQIETLERKLAKQEENNTQVKHKLQDLIEIVENYRLRLETHIKQHQLKKEKIEVKSTARSSGGGANTGRGNSGQAMVRIREPEEPKINRKVRRYTTAKSKAAMLYHQATNFFNQRNYPQAINAYTKFLRAYPHHRNADNCYYWIGESYFNQGEYKLALVEFMEVIEKYPRGNKLADSYFMVGKCYLHLHHKSESIRAFKQARSIFNRIINRYPESEAANHAHKRLFEIGNLAP